MISFWTFQHSNLRLYGRFNAVTERFFTELNCRHNDTNKDRSEILSIISGMRYLKLGVRGFVYFSVSTYINILAEIITI